MMQAALKVGSPTSTQAELVHAPGSPIADLRRACLRIAASDATVLLTGETGTGKEVFARLLHTGSERAQRQFVPVNCGAIPEALLESELFGFVKGAFTGAATSRKGRVAMAEGGTLFLDEIGELPLALQAKLLRLLQERTYEPVGSSESVTANFRLIAATNRDLLEEVRAGRFRLDLYYRLHVCPVRLPALRERRMDIAPLFFHFWQRRGEQRPVAPEVLHCLEAYGWPGNVRELENLVERISVCSEGPMIQLADLPPVLRGEPEESPFGLLLGGNPMRDHLALATPPPEVLPPARPVATLPPPPPAIPAAAGAELPYFVGVAGAGPRPVPPAPFAPPASSFAAASAAYRYDAVTPPPVAIGADGVVREEIGAASDTQEIVTGNPVPPVGPESSLQLPVDLPRLLRELETAYINRALAHTGGNKKEAARLLGMGRTTLVEKLRRRNADASTP
jgi:sigma-54 specific flagellar transcriptional regulator A